MNLTTTQVLLTWLLLLSTPTLFADDRTAIQPLLKTYCVRCHGPQKQKGDVRLDRLQTLNPETFATVYEQLASGQMPPDDQRQPSRTERETLLRHTLQLAKNVSTIATPGLRRLNKREYGNTVRDLLGLDQGLFDPGEYIYDDEIDDGFDTNADSLVISNELLLEYMQAAKQSLRHSLFNSATSKPKPKTINVRTGRMKGVGGNRYVNNSKQHTICRCGGKGMIYDGSSATRIVQIPGRYRITVTAAAVDRGNYAVRFAPVSGSVVMGFGVKRDATQSVSGKAKLLKTFKTMSIKRLHSIRGSTKITLRTFRLRTDHRSQSHRFGPISVAAKSKRLR